MENQRKSVEFARQCVAEEIGLGLSLPGEEEDLVLSGTLDSMGWVGVLTVIEAATGIHNFGNPWPAGRPQSIRALAEAIVEGFAQLAPGSANRASTRAASSGPIISVAGWGQALGSRLMESAEIETICALAVGTIRDRAGIESVRQAGDREDEVTLAQQAAEAALEKAGLDIPDVDLLVATSTTFLRLPSLAATLHTRLLLPESSGAFDVGGACVGVVQALATAKALLAAGSSRHALVVAADLPSRRLTSSSAPGEFRGLFGAGACAFALSRFESAGTAGRCWRLGDFVWGCAGEFAASLRLEIPENSPLQVEFEGEPLARAALRQLERLVQNLEALTGKPRSEVAYFALHEPNPRVAEILSRNSGIPLEKMAPISRTCGNLGAATCGVNLCTALAKVDGSFSGPSGSPPAVVFVAAVGPGMLFGGTWLERLERIAQS
ncbi:MAG: hypothetical protein ACLQOO_15670 [Terriglobia bacterium]